jgi:hypothetical protein
MALRIRFQYVSGSNLGFAVERLADGMLLDHSDNTFKTAPTQTIAPLTEAASPRQGMYRATLTTTPIAQFSDGNYNVSVHDLSSPNQRVLALLMAQMIAGDDNTVASGGSGGSPDILAISRGVWEFATNSTSVTGTFGNLVKDNLDAKVSTRSTFAGGAVASVTNPVTVGVNPVAKDIWDYAAASATVSGSLGLLVRDNLDAKVSTRSTFAGGAVASVTNPVIVNGPAVAKDVWDYAAASAIVSGSLGLLVKDNLDAKVSTRSTFAGGAVASVTNPVTVGVNQDKVGYSLSPAGLDQVMIETGVNIRQAISPILAATSGVIVSSQNGQFSIKGGNSTVTRIQAVADSAGNRTNVILTLPS